MLDFKTYDYNERATYLNSKKAQDPNKIVSVWEDDSSGNIVFNTIEFVGDEAFPSPKVNVREDWDTHVPTAIQLSNDTYAIATVNYVGGKRLTEIHIHAEDGTQLSTTEIQTPGDDQINNQLVDMGNGRFVLHYQIHDDFPGDNPMGQALQILDYDGNPIGSQLQTNFGDDNNHRSDIIALNDHDLATVKIQTQGDEAFLNFEVVNIQEHIDNNGISMSGAHIHSFETGLTGNLELIETENGLLITFGDGDTFYLAELGSDGQLINTPRPILTGIDSDTVLTATQIDDKIAVAYSKGDQALDESEVFFSVVNASDLSVVIPEQKVADGKVATNTNLLTYDEPISGDHALGFAYYSDSSDSNEAKFAYLNFSQALNQSQQLNIIEGTDESDDLLGTVGPDSIMGYDGDDTIDGSGGDV